ncbi:endoglucanase A precursor [Xylogone sp. PMI_703]|nr:endoglucanase A precursor [Xylogone sp. PMI_703]KAH8806176.1 endoglucanase A precursor [Xylogone sp. PMI_703]
MKFSIILLFSLNALAAVIPTRTLQERADICGQWDSITTGSYIVYQDLWGMSSGTGSQCSGVDSLSGSTLAWHTKWSWSGGSSSVKSFANVALQMSATQLSRISSIPSSWSWKYTGSNIDADVAYDMFTSSSSSGSNEYEVMVWLAALGGAGPISSTGSPIATPSIDGQTWRLFYGLNGNMKVYSFVANSGSVSNFSGDLLNFFKYLESSQGMPSSQYLLSIQAGTEPFTGSNAQLAVTSYKVSLST